MPEQAHTDYKTLEDRVRVVVEEVIAASNLFLVDLVVRGRKGSRVVEVFLDSDEALTVDVLAEASREIGFLLDVEEVIDGKYRLNVSSPGLDRPLRLPRQFRKNQGRTLRLRYREGTAEEATLKGILEAAETDVIHLRTGNDTVRIPYQNILEARVELPW